MYGGDLHVSEHSVVNFTDNIAYLQGGYISIDSHSLLTLILATTLLVKEGHFIYHHQLL